MTSKRFRARRAAPPPRRMTLVGPFPPPVGGAASITRAMADELAARGVLTDVINTAAGRLGHQKSWAYHLARLMRTARAAVQVATLSRSASAAYVVPDAGHGAWYTMVYCLVLRPPARGRVVFHHHSCRYLDHHSAAMRAIVGLTRGRAVHLFLTEEMAERFQGRYGPISHRVVGNACFTHRDAALHADREPGLLRLGHLSNLCTAKGYFDVVEAFELLRSRGVAAELHLAGPVLEGRVGLDLARLQQRHGAAVVVHGPVYGQDKWTFYELIDVFLFPTRFDQEAAPKVIYEAASRGVPALSVDRGCIREIVPALGGAVCDRDAGFGDFVARWLDDSPLCDIHEQRAAITARFADEHTRADRQLSEFLDEVESILTDAHGDASRWNSAIRRHEE